MRWASPRSARGPADACVVHERGPRRGEMGRGLHIREEVGRGSAGRGGEGGGTHLCLPHELDDSRLVLGLGCAETRLEVTYLSLVLGEHFVEVGRVTLVGLIGLRAPTEHVENEVVSQGIGSPASTQAASAGACTSACACGPS